jgi:tRNA-dihydrouridine synthase A
VKREHPELRVILNGGLRSLDEVRQWLPQFDGVMLGRQAYQDPYLLAELHREFIDPAWPLAVRHEVVLAYADYVERMQGQGHRLPLMLRPAMGLYAGFPGARSWRRFLSEQGTRAGASAELLRQSLRIFGEAA